MTQYEKKISTTLGVFIGICLVALIVLAGSPKENVSASSGTISFSASPGFLISPDPLSPKSFLSSINPKKTTWGELVLNSQRSKEALTELTVDKATSVLPYDNNTLVMTIESNGVGVQKTLSEALKNPFSINLPANKKTLVRVSAVSISRENRVENIKINFKPHVNVSPIPASGPVPVDPETKKTGGGS